MPGRKHSVFKCAAEEALPWRCAIPFSAFDESGDGEQGAAEDMAMGAAEATLQHLRYGPSG